MTNEDEQTIINDTYSKLLGTILGMVHRQNVAIRRLNEVGPVLPDVTEEVDRINTALAETLRDLVGLMND